MAQPTPYSNLPTPEQIAWQRKLGTGMLEKGMDASPVGHWTQGLARVIQGGVGGYRTSQADSMEQDRNSGLVNALRGSGIIPNMTDADATIMGNNPDILGGVYKASMTKRMGSPSEFGKAGTIFQGEDGRYYGVQFGNNQPPAVHPLTQGGQPLRPAKGVFQVGDEVIDKTDGRTVRNVAPQIENKEAAEKIGAARGQAVSDLPRVADNAAQALDVIQQIRNHPGKQYGTGAIGGYLPAVPGTAQAGFVDLVDQAKGKTFLEAFNSLKGGGQITEAEGKKATDALARLNRARRQEDFDKALSDLEAVIQAGAVRAYRSARQAPQPITPSPGSARPPVRIDSAVAEPVAPSLPVEQRYGPQPPPPQAVQFLKQNPTPEVIQAFEEKYGLKPGSAKTYLMQR